MFLFVVLLSCVRSARPSETSIWQNSQVVVDEVDVRHTIHVDMCSVCQETFVVDESVRKLPCGHLYVLHCPLCVD